MSYLRRYNEECGKKLILNLHLMYPHTKSKYTRNKNLITSINDIKNIIIDNEYRIDAKKESVKKGLFLFSGQPLYIITLISGVLRKIGIL